jgi:prolyl 4-hydroxylase
MKVIFWTLLLFVCYVVMRTHASFEDEFEEPYDDEFVMSETGEILDINAHDQGSAKSLSVTFTNTLEDDTLNLYWVGDNGENVLIADIPPASSVDVTTYASHLFTAKPTLSQATISPPMVTIKPTQLEYSFANADSSKGGSLPAGFAPQTEKPFYRLLNTPSTSASAKFRNIIPAKVDVYFDDGKDGIPQGTLELGMEYTVNSYAGHVFFFTEHKQKHKVLARHTVDPKRVLYIIEDKKRPPPLHMREHIQREEAFMSEYLAKTGREWRHYFSPEGKPRDPPTQFMWPADFEGQQHVVETTEAYWTCRGDPTQCHAPSKQPQRLNLTVLSTAPRAFFIEHFLSPVEVDAIIETAAPIMAGSYVGNKDGGGARKSDTRTSRNAWVPRDANEITESLFRRAEQLLKIPRLDRSNTEDMQVVHYVYGQKYDAHHDWGVSGYPESRYITLLLYLTDMAAPDGGGETAFPKAANGLGFKIHPGKGNAVLFYNLLPDGNGDDLSLHAALPVLKGEKWLANFWVWDPKRR